MLTAQQIIKKAGGVTVLAQKLSLPVGTVGAWSTRNSVPPEHAAQVAKLAKMHPHDIRPDIFPKRTTRKASQ